MLSTHQNFDFDLLTFGKETRNNSNGGKYVQVSYKARQVEFQLGQASELLRVPFGLDSASKEDTTRKVIKMELTPETLDYIQKLEEATVKAAKVNSLAWFNKKMNEHEIRAMFCSSIKHTHARRSTYPHISPDEGVDLSLCVGGGGGGI